MTGVLLGNFAGGISIGWWKRSHNVHHVVCNSVEHDPDIQHLPALSVSPKIFKGFWSTYHMKAFVFDPVARFLVAYQHVLYYPIMGLARVNLYIQSWKLLLSSEYVRFKPLEIVTLAGFFTWYTCLVYSLPSNERFWYFLLSHVVSGMLHVQITLSHFYMDTFNGHPYTPAEIESQWWHLQLKTTMDIDCPEWMDWFHGGLQFQIEHHLFPRMPRHSYRKI